VGTSTLEKCTRCLLRVAGDTGHRRLGRRGGLWRALLVSCACWALLLPRASLAVEPVAGAGHGPMLEGPVGQRRIRPWLLRPVGEGALRVTPDRFYPYGATGHGRYQVHHGVEFVNPYGTPVIAAGDGTVVVAGTDDQEVWGRHPDYYGQLVVIRLAQRYRGLAIYLLYGHLSRIHVQPGQQVARGEAIGEVGMSGVAIGPHLHFEVRVGRNTFGNTRNPELWLPPLPGHGTIVGRILDARGRPVPGALVTFHTAARPNRYWREAWTYAEDPERRVHGDGLWRENVAMGDVPAGEYTVHVRIEGRLYTRQVSVGEGQVASFTVRAEGKAPRPYPGTVPHLVE
jgi:murein DD-endopeptidase MepM/ murein hydrolase activator NlpD